MSKFVRMVSGHCMMPIRVRFFVEKFDFCFAIYQLKEEEEKVTRKSVIERVKRNYRIYGSNLYQELGPSKSDYSDDDDLEQDDSYEEDWDKLNAEIQKLEPEFLKLFPEWKPFDKTIAEQHKQ